MVSFLGIIFLSESMNFLLRNIFFVFVLIFVIIDGLFLFGESILSLEMSTIIQAYSIYIPVIAIMEVLVLTTLAYFTSIKPVRALKREIAFFLAGSKQ